MDYNKFHYYRSNPYSQEGFIPPIAHKNRNHTSFLPQGQSVFTHDTRKHFIDATNRSNIQEQSIMHPQNFGNDQRYVMGKNYRRNLETLDIDGASPNSKLNPAVRNKEKAHQQILKHQVQKSSYEEIRRLQEKEKEQNKKFLMQQYKKNQYMADLISGKYLRKNEGKQHQKIKEENNNHSQFMSLDGNERKMYEQKQQLRYDLHYNGNSQGQRQNSEQNSFYLAGKNLLHY